MPAAADRIEFPRGGDPWSEPQARALLRLVEDIFHRRDLEALVSGFTDDCVVRFSTVPEFRGREKLRELFAARFARQQGYRLRKTLRMLKGNQLGNAWTGTWTDARSGKPMEGFGVEFWTMRDGRIAVWEASFSVWEVGGERSSGVT